MQMNSNHVRKLHGAPAKGIGRNCPSAIRMVTNSIALGLRICLGCSCQSSSKYFFCFNVPAQAKKRLHSVNSYSLIQRIRLCILEEEDWRNVLMVKKKVRKELLRH